MTSTSSSRSPTRVARRRLQVAYHLGVKYREGFIKNRYIGRTFIMPGQAERVQSVRRKLNAIDLEFRGKNVLLIDDSIVRGTTSKQIIKLAREAGARKVYFASAAPPVRYPNVYGIDMPAASELIANGRDTEEIQELIGADRLIYQDLHGLIRSVRHDNSSISEFDTSCFSGEYVTGDVTEEYLSELESRRNDAAKRGRKKKHQQAVRQGRVAIGVAEIGVSLPNSPSGYALGSVYLFPVRSEDRVLCQWEIGKLTPIIPVLESVESEVSKLSLMSIKVMIIDGQPDFPHAAHAPCHDELARCHHHGPTTRPWPDICPMSSPAPGTISFSSAVSTAIATALTYCAPFLQARPVSRPSFTSGTEDDQEEAQDVASRQQHFIREHISHDSLVVSLSDVLLASQPHGVDGCAVPR